MGYFDALVIQASGLTAEAVAQQNETKELEDKMETVVGALKDLERDELGEAIMDMEESI